MRVTIEKQEKYPYYILEEASPENFDEAREMPQALFDEYNKVQWRLEELESEIDEIRASQFKTSDPYP